MNSSYSSQALEMGEVPVSEIDVDARATFISRTYGHLFGAMALFTGIEVAIFKAGLAEKMFDAMMGRWIIVLGAFMVVSWIASHMAARARTLPVQYMALIGFVAVEAVIFVPLLYIANAVADGLIASAAIVTMGGFAGLTFIAFATRKDFSFLGGIIKFGMFAALLAILAGWMFGFQLGTFFSVGMVVLAGAAILYDTSNILHHYPEDRYVSAALGLFSSVALMFWYVLRIFIAFANND